MEEQNFSQILDIKYKEVVQLKTVRKYILRGVKNEVIKEKKYQENRGPGKRVSIVIYCNLFRVKHQFKYFDRLYCVLLLSAISPCTTGLKALFDLSDCTSTTQLLSY